MKPDFLFVPGPVNVPRRVALAEAREVIYHRGEEFAELLKSVDAKLKRVFRTQNTILYFTSSGTGAMEACVTNLLNSNDEVLVIEGGKFGQRWREICQAFRVKHHVIALEWGRAVRPEQIEEALSAHPKISAVFVQLSETSTGTVYDIESIAKITNKRDILLVVDAISGLGVVPLEPDEWGVDCVVAASQKALMVPPGLAFVSVSERAWARVEKSDLPKYYWDFKSARKNLYFTPFTPAISLVMALDEALNVILEEGVDHLLARTELYARATRAAVTAMGLRLFSERPGAVCTAIWVPAGLNGKEILESLRQEFGIKISGGQDHLKGKILRIGHIGDLGPKDVLGVIAALELTLHKLGYKFELGAGVRAAMEVFAESRSLAVVGGR
ncbi:MAG: alanine--glyoxylate aminotransferase family protein [Candidatus Bipolaricaulota bacterium]|nr:alanine--glyoxylate aminotransferase family protein [Candidatus Bipolaricaulota bacterium]MCS7275183.1 alanine--glyoxylate aminotransferase family protein [Candidatus Bipolaricaulota bacterium]MDW8110448.1 alanine--glyoxylate aminotransferase family protein [Candidatus Bipolaricaulota bacterium]MDW8329678.1 alanine--glyoxylate aminotransferase family protein [Candidatus Bipolaricaulota bacterium]